jgi:hypothetical protein
MSKRTIQEQPWFTLITLAIAMIGAVTGVLSLVLGAEDRTEQRRVEVVVRAAANQRDFTNEGFGLRVSVVNSGLRGVAITDASLYLAGHLLGVASNYLGTRRPLDRYLMEPAAVTDQRLDLPVSVPTRGERNIVLLFEAIQMLPFERSSSPATHDPSLGGSRARKWRQKFDAFLVDTRVKARLTVALHLQPGGRQRYRVTRLVGMTPRFQWQVALHGRRHRATSISIRRKLAAPGQSDVMTLDVWSETGRQYHRSTSRALVGDYPSSFPLAGLHRGRYLYAFRSLGRTLLAGRFRVPEPCSTKSDIPLLEQDPFTFRLVPLGSTCRAGLS